MSTTAIVLNTNYALQSTPYLLEWPGYPGYCITLEVISNSQTGRLKPINGLTAGLDDISGGFKGGSGGGDRPLLTQNFCQKAAFLRAKGIQIVV